MKLGLSEDITAALAAAIRKESAKAILEEKVRVVLTLIADVRAFADRYGLDIPDILRSQASEEQSEEDRIRAREEYENDREYYDRALRDGDPERPIIKYSELIRRCEEEGWSASGLCSSHYDGYEVLWDQ